MQRQMRLQRTQPINLICNVSECVGKLVSNRFWKFYHFSLLHANPILND